MKLRNLIFTSLLVVAALFPQRAFAAIVINEFLADPPLGIAGDSNRDGTRHASQDEFVELLNTGGVPSDLSLWSLWDSSALRHQFLQGTILPPSARLVVFGGGNPTDIPGIAVTASSGSLSLNNSGDIIFLKNSLGETVDQDAFSHEADQDQSLNRFPEGTGVFQLHRSISTQLLSFSPGTDPDGRTSHEVPPTPEPVTSLSFGIGLLMIGAAMKKRVRSI